MLVEEAVSGFVRGYFQTSRRSEKTRRAYSTDLRQFSEEFGTSRLGEIGARELERWAGRLAGDGLAPASIRRKFAVVRVLFRYWARRGLIEVSPFASVRLDLRPDRELPKTLTEREFRRLLQAAADAPRATTTQRRRLLALRNHAIIEVLFATGIRIGELVSLDLDCFDQDDGTLHVRGKGGRHRYGVLPDTTSSGALLNYLAARKRDGCCALFLNSRGRRLSTQGAANAIAQLARAAAISRRVTPHMLRHTVATQLLERGADIRLVQEFLGHRSIATTQRYTHVTRSHLRSMALSHHPNLGALRRSPALDQDPAQSLLPL